MGGAIGRIVDDVVSFIGRPFGIYTHDETFTDIQISNLLTPDVADSDARKTAQRDAEGDVDAFFDAYRAFQRDYRKKYSQKFLENLGYAPTSTAQARIVVESQLETYLEGLYGYADVNVIDYGDRYLTLNEKGNHALTNYTGYDFTTGHITDSGKVYELLNYSNGAPSNQVSLNMRRLYEETIIQNLTDNYAYDGTYIYITGEQYLVGVIDGTINISDEYETVCTHVGPTIPALPDETILTPVEYQSFIVINSAYGTEASYASYSVTSGEVGTETRYWVTEADTVSAIYNTTTVNMTAIIPMKEDNVMVDLDSRNLDRMLRRLNLSAEQLRGSIENPDMDGAYLLTGLDVQDNSPIGNKVTFQFFDLLAPGTGDIVISISKLNMRYAFSMARSNVTGSIGAVGTYTKTVGGTSGAGRTWTLKWQASATEYQQIVVSNYEQTYTISGNPLTAYLDSTGGYGRIIIPLDILNALTYKEFVYIYERSLCMLAFSIEVVEVKWYETGAFGTLLKIVAVVVTIMSLGSLGAAAMAVVNYVGATMALTFMQVMTLVVITNILVAVAVGMAIGFIADNIGGGSAGAIVGAIAAIYAQQYAINGASTSFTSSQWMSMANNALSSYNQHIEHKMQELTTSSQAILEELQNNISELEDKMSEFENDVSRNFSEIIGGPNPIFSSIERYCDGITKTDVENIVDYGLQIEYAIDTRLNPSVGIE